MSAKMGQEDLTVAELVNTDFINCVVCKKPYTSPVILPCLHSFCLDCVVHLALDSIKQNIANKQRKGRQHQKVSFTEDDGRQKLSVFTINGSNTLEMECPTCLCQLTLAWVKTSSQLDATVSIAKDESSGHQSKAQGQNCDRNDRMKVQSNFQQSGTNGLKDDSATEALLREVIAQSLATNHFLGSISRLYGHKFNQGKECLYCKTDGSSVTATHLCIDCKDDMCDTCAGAHRKTRVTSGHIVAPHEQIQHGLYDHDIRSHDFIPCEDHPSTTVTHFCTTCAQIVCKLCRSRNHYNHDLLTLHDAAAKFVSEVEHVQSGIARRVPSLSQYSQFLNEQIKNMNTKKNKIIENLNSQTELIHKLIEEYKTRTISRLETACAEEISTIQSKISTITCAETSLSDTAHFLLHLVRLGRSEEILSLYSAVISRHKQLVHATPDMVETKLAALFNPGPTSDKNIEILVGSLAVSKIPMNKDDLPQSRLSISTLMPTIQSPTTLAHSFMTACPRMDDKTIYPSGIAINNNMIATVDRENVRIKIFNHSGRLLKDFNGEKENKLKKPFDVTFLPNGALAVTDTSAGRVSVFDWTGKFITNFEGGEQIRHPRGITLDKNERVLVLDGHLRHITIHDSHSGKLLKTIKPLDADTSSDKCALVDPFYISTTVENNIAITDIAAPNVKILSCDSGEVLATSGDYGINSEESLHPSGVAVDKTGYIFVADTNNGRVHVGLPDGQLSQTLLENKCHGISHPIAVEVFPKDHGLLAIAEAGGKVHVVQYL